MTAARAMPSLCSILLWTLLVSAPIPAAEVRVSVAISMRPTLDEIVEAWNRRPDDLTVRFNAAASGVLMQQARRGAPVDLFVSASPDELDRLAARGLLDSASRRLIAANRLVLVAPSGTAAARHPRDLLAADRVAVANPRTAPLGRYGEQSLRAAGVWSTLESRLVFAESARQVVDYVARGDVAAGLVYATDARRFAGRLAIGGTLSPASHDPIHYEAASMRDAQDPTATALLLDHLGSPTARAILERNGFLLPAAED